MERIVNLAVNLILWTLSLDIERNFFVLSVFLTCKNSDNRKNQQRKEDSPHNGNNNQYIEWFVKQIDITVCGKNIIRLYEGNKIKIVEQSVI